MELIQFLGGRFGQLNWVAWVVPLTLRPIAQLGIGLYLFSGGRAVVDQIIPSNRPYCHDCGYDLTGARTGICPECGTAFKAPPVQDAEPHH